MHSAAGVKTVTTQSRAAPTPRNMRMLREQKRQKRKKNFSIALSVFALMMMLSGLQAMLYYTHFVPRVDETNAKVTAFTQERSSMKVQKQVQEQFRALIDSLKDEQPYAALVLDQFELLAKLFRQSPIQTADEVHEALLSMSEKFKKDGETDSKPILVTSSANILLLADDLKKLREIFTVEFDLLQADLENPPWYTWPTGRLLRHQTGYLAAVTFNRAMYLSQIGETGTARVLLTGLYSAAGNEPMMPMIYYGLGRLQWEIFLTGSKPENYFQAAKYLRQSIQSDPDKNMAKRLFDFMMSLSEGDSSPQQGEGDPTNPSEGESASVSEATSLF